MLTTWEGNNVKGLCDLRTAGVVRADGRGFMALRESSENLDRRTNETKGGRRQREESQLSPLWQSYSTAPVDVTKEETEAAATLDL